MPAPILPPLLRSSRSSTRSRCLSMTRADTLPPFCKLFLKKTKRKQNFNISVL